MGIKKDTRNDFGWQWVAVMVRQWDFEMMGRLERLWRLIQQKELLIAIIFLFLGEGTMEKWDNGMILWARGG